MYELMSVAKAASLLDISRKRVYQLINTGRLASLRTSPRAIRVTRASVEEFVETQVAREREQLGLDIPPLPTLRRSRH